MTETAPERCPSRPSPDTARPGRPPLVTSRRALVTLAGAAFVYVTAETLPVGLVPQLSAGLHVRPGTVGLLVTVYAAMAGLSAIPLTAALEHRSRRQVVAGCVVLLALSQFLIAVAPDYAVVLAARVITVLVVTGHFTAYTYITALVRSDAGFTGLALSAVLFAYGAAGIGGIWLAGRLTDQRPRRTTAACALGVTVALTGLTTVAHGSAAITVAAVIVWGAAFTALPVCLQAAVLRVAPRSADTASALYVVAFQIGIGGGALAGSLLVDTGVLAGLCVIGAALAAAGLLIVLTARRAFPSRPERRLGDCPPGG